MSGHEPLATEDRRALWLPNYSTRLQPRPPPSVGAFVSPLVGCCINAEWMSHILGALATLEWPDAWEGTADQVQFALDQIVEIQDAMATRCNVGTSVIINNVVENYRFQLGLEFTLNGLTGVAPDRPDTFFDEDSGDIGDDIIVRENALCMACIDYINTVLDSAAATALDAGLTVGTSLTVPAFAFGPLSGVIFLATVGILTAGVRAVLNSESIRADIACCMFEGLRGKAINEANFQTALTDCGFFPLSDPEIIRDLVETGLDDQANFLAFVRAVGGYFSFAELEPLSCPCIEQGLYCDFKIDECDFEVFIGPTGPEAAFDFPNGWKAGPSGVINHLIHIKSEFDEDIAFSSVRIFTVNSLGTDIKYTMWLYDEFDVLILNQNIQLPKEHTNHKFEFPEETGVRRLEVQIFKTGLATVFPGRLTACQVEADPPPFPPQTP